MARKMPKLSCLDKFLIAGIVLGLLLTAIMAMTVLRRDLHRMYMYDRHREGRSGGRHREGPDGPDHRPLHLGPKGEEFKEVDCDVDGVEESEETVECGQNSRGEWCDVKNIAREIFAAIKNRANSRQKRSHSEEGGGSDSHEERHLERGHGERGHEERGHEERGHHRRGMRRGGRHHRFRCMRMRVSIRGEGNGRIIHAQAFENITTMMNFPGCSFSRCGEDEAKNMAEVEAAREEWMAHKKEKMPARCLFSKAHPGKAVLLPHRHHFRQIFTSAGFHATFWPFMVAVICCCILTVLRCCCVGKASEEKKVSPTSAADTYVVSATPEISEKEREAFGLPPIDDGSQLPDAPPKVSPTSAADTYVVSATPEISEKEREALGLPPIDDGSQLPDALPKADFLVLVPPAYAEIVKSRPVSASSLPPAYLATIGDQKSHPADTSVAPVE